MTRFGRPHKHFAECGSTNDLAREWAADTSNPAPSGALVTADFQTRGRGQRGHQWQAEAGQSALLSYVYRLPPGADASQLGLVTALAAAESCRTPAAEAQIKWPNDILLNGKKAAGVLVEVGAGVAILGIGINVSQSKFAGAAEYAYPPTSLRLEGADNPTIQNVVKTLNHCLTGWEERWRCEGFSVVVERCREVLAAGAAVRQGSVSGDLIGLSEHGAALVRLADGTFQEWTTVN